MIVVYTSPGCASCRKVKQWLKDRNLPFTEKNIFKTLLNEEEILVMYTCWPFEFSAGRKTDRLTVFGKRIKGYDVKWRTYEEDY